MNTTFIFRISNYWRRNLNSWHWFLGIIKNNFTLFLNDSNISSIQILTSSFLISIFQQKIFSSCIQPPKTPPLAPYPIPSPDPHRDPPGPLQLPHRNFTSTIGNWSLPCHNLIFFPITTHIWKECLIFLWILTQKSWYSCRLMG